MEHNFDGKDIFAIYKPKGPTSNDVLQEIRRRSGVKKVGHAGTLDPLAEGVLVIGIGREATKKLTEMVKKEKEYLAVIKLGSESSTDDEEGEKTDWPVETKPSADEIQEALKKFKGKISQTPPVFSAIKIRGVEAYKLARAKKEVALKPRIVEVKNIEFLEYNWPYLKLKITTGPGVYVRSLARDLGKELKTGGYLADLKRTRVGDFREEKTVDISQITLSAISKRSLLNSRRE